MILDKILIGFVLIFIDLHIYFLEKIGIESPRSCFWRNRISNGNYGKGETQAGGVSASSACVFIAQGG